MNNEISQLKEWIPLLVSEKIEHMSIIQLRLLHYILGYETEPMPIKELSDIFQQYDYSESESQNIISILEQEGLLVIEKPY